MADLWDTDDESAVEELLAQAQDQSLLDQISAINCSGFSHSDLPPDLDSRFRRLKSIPPPPAPTTPLSVNLNPSPPANFKSGGDGLTSLNSRTEKGTSPSKKSVEKTTSLPGSESPDSSLELEPEPESESPSPPRKSGCFWCSPKKASGRRKKGKEFVADLGILSEKSQRKLMKRAMKEEERINREVEKIVNLAKQASFRI